MTVAQLPKSSPLMVNIRMLTHGVKLPTMMPTLAAIAAIKANR